MPRYKILLEYEGTNYSGWQIQKKDPSIQAVLEKALSVALRTPTNVVGSGRTDAGVHARGQVGHFDYSDAIDEGRLEASLNGLLPDDIAVRAIEPVPDAFHARYDATSRLYRYYVTTGPTALQRRCRVRIQAHTDFELMNSVAPVLVTQADFSSFCRTQSETRNRVCHVKRALWVAEQDDFYHFEVQADRFLHGMVRAIVGTLLEIGRGIRPATDLSRILDVRDRREAGPAAPAQGLVLEQVTYSR